MNPEIVLVGHATVKIVGEKTVYIDPYEIPDGSDSADIVLITHNHYDHCSPADVKKVMRGDTVILYTPDCQSTINRVIDEGDRVVVEPGKEYDVLGITIKTVPAYNIDKQFHPKENEWVGYVMIIGGKRIYHAGDSDVTPEMKAVKADIILLPVGGTYTMTAEEAASAANVIQPELAIPMHYGAIVGSKDDAEKFKELCSCEVSILK